MKKYFLLLTGFFMLPYIYAQQAGNLDHSFADKGWATLRLGESGNINDETARQVLRQADGKYVLLIRLWNSNYSVLARYNSNGSLDGSFGINGFSEPINLREAVSAAFQTIDGDSKILVAGESSEYASGDFGLTRFNSNGTLDKTFGMGGKVTTDFYGDEDRANAITVQGFDNKILVAGMALYTNGSGDFALARYNSNGSLDAGFGDGGKASIDFYGDVDYANAIVVQSDHKILLAGTANNATSTYDEFAVVRWNSEGSLDTDFGTGGKVSTDINGNMDVANAITIQNIGGVDKIVVAGQTWTPSGVTGFDFAVVRYNTDGSPDTDFSIDGKVTSDFDGWHDIIYALAIEGEKIVVAGEAEVSTSTNFGFIRYNVDGSLDTGFGTNGLLAFRGSSYSADVRSLLLDGENIVAAGGARDPDNPYSGGYDFALLKLDNSGSLVSSFGTGGVITGFYSPGPNTSVNAMALQNISGGTKILLAGTSNKDFALTRYNSDGTVDNGFGDNGKVFTNFWGPDSARAVGIQSIGGVDKIIVAGTSYESESGYPSFSLARYAADGSPDTSFGHDGKILGFIGQSDFMSGMAIQSDGKIILAGQTVIYNIGQGSRDSSFAIMRFRADGFPDSTFGTNGIVLTGFYGYSDSATSIALQPGGKIVVAGKAINASGHSDFAVVRYNANGSLDASFGSGGKLTTDFGGYDDVASSLVIQPDGKILVAGYETDSSGNQNFGLARYTTKGRLDATFGSQGKLITDFNGYNDVVCTLQLQSDGKILAAGSAETNSAGVGLQNDFAIARYDAAGVPDASFAQSGKLTTHFGYAEAVFSSAWKNDKLYLAGAVNAVEGFAFPSTLGIVAVYLTSVNPPPVVTINDVTVNEGETAKLTVSLDKASSSTITLNYATQDVSAVSKGKNADYKPLKGTVVFSPLQTTAEIRIATNIDNLLQEGSETFNVNLSLTGPTANLVTIGDGTGVVTINNGTALVENTRTSVDAPDQNQADGLVVNVFPNPSAGYFTLQLQSRLNSTVTAQITDVAGRIVETRTGIDPNGNLPFGYGYRAGVYYIQIIQGSQKVALKIVKQ